MNNTAFKTMLVGSFELLTFRLIFGTIIYIITGFIVILATYQQMVIVWEVMPIYVGLYLFIILIVYARENDEEPYKATFFSFNEVLYLNFLYLINLNFGFIMARLCLIMFF
jgi:hypothetical protein